MAVFILHTLRPNDYRILFKLNGKIEFSSKPFNSRVEGLQMIRFMRNKCHKDIFYKIKNLNCGSWCFEFVEPNNKNILGWSETYIDKVTVLNRISKMKSCAQKAAFESN